MSFVRQVGCEAAIAKIGRIRNFLGSGRKVSLLLAERSSTILTVQALAGRNVTNLTKGEVGEIGKLVREHVRANNRASGEDAQEAGRQMHIAVAELGRDIIADKIADRRACRKAPLSPEYAKTKLARWGRTAPILVASGELLSDVEDAWVRLEDK